MNAPPREGTRFQRPLFHHWSPHQDKHAFKTPTALAIHSSPFHDDPIMSRIVGSCSSTSVEGVSLIGGLVLCLGMRRRLSVPPGLTEAPHVAPEGKGE